MLQTEISGKFVIYLSCFSLFVNFLPLPPLGSVCRLYFTFRKEVINFTDQAPVVQRPDNFIRWIRHYSGSKIYVTLNVVQGFRILSNLAVVRVCIFACTRGNTKIFAQIETVG